MAVLTVSVKPGSKQPGIVVESGVITLRVRERAIDGAANSGCVRTLAEALDIPKSSIVLERGARARTKTFRIDAMSDADALRRLQARKAEGT